MSIITESRKERVILNAVKDLHPQAHETMAGDPSLRSGRHRVTFFRRFI